MATNVSDKVCYFISRSQGFLFTYLIFLYQGDKGHLLKKNIKTVCSKWVGYIDI
jgi:hypothetical protein